ncbi:hypothetical protein CGZ93_12415 [Enemella dayhoffiae]|uniref:DUF1707 domain-containing protein n=1 Tax=Enemella dayhoffiae TaxID=2016507 RepID=A0A255GZG2_9ACTN|nr:DUF1707 domain-containing protein [Enemella dayhoffiae]OYO20999.1 hypothetical protein CGZ93_12415 [Enemella dayhoffiae]
MTVPDTHRSNPKPPPALRIGDAERTEVCELLNQHFTAGRLTLDELQDRLDACVRARTAADLHGLCQDLPRIAPPAPAEPALHPVTRRNGPVRDLVFALVAVGVALSVPIVMLMLLGSTILGEAVFVFSVLGGTLAAFLGAGTTYLIMSSATPRQSRRVQPAATAVPRPVPATGPAGVSRAW